MKGNDENKEEKESKQQEDNDNDDEYEFPPYIFPEDENKIDGELISDEDINELLLVLFGTNAKNHDVDRWYAQGLGFIKDCQDENEQNNAKNNDIRFGLLQIHGGPCGVMAPVQVLPSIYSLTSANIRSIQH